MEETILYPSPNWFLPSVIAVSQDGWLVYGGPGKSLIVLEPLSPDEDPVIDSKHRHRAYVVNKSHKERVVTVDISPQWPEKRQFVTGSSDGVVKIWSITQVDNKWVIKNTHSHEVHANDKEEIVTVGYSRANHIISVGNFSNITIWELNTNVTKSFQNLMKNFKATCMSCSPHLELVVAVGTKQGVVFVLDLNERGNVVYKVRGQDDEIAQVAWCPQYEVTLKRSFEPKKSVATLRMEKIRNEPEPNDPDTSGVDKTLPEDSFDEPIVQEDDMFDIYKDHEAEEFGHKKYEPEDIVVKIKDESKTTDFLAECEKLKAEILKKKQEDEEPIANLVEAMDKAHLEGESKSPEKVKTVSGAAKLAASGSKLVPDDGSSHIHKHLLASISKNGYSVRIWSKTGKIAASCAVIVNKTGSKQFPNKQPMYASLCWYKPDSLLIADGKVNLIECNPLQVDCRSRLQWSIVHSAHRRGIYFVAATSPKVQTPETLQSFTEDNSYVWTTAQDRFMVKYDMIQRKVVAKYASCGGSIYDVKPCPYDAGKIAMSVGDGAVRVWENRASGEEDNQLTAGDVSCHWQNVQGKILQAAWHPTRENLLAFSTAESRVGLIDISKPDRPAKVLHSALTQGVYSIAWGDNMTLFAVGGRELVMYQANKPDQAPIPIVIEIEGQVWSPCVVNYSFRGLSVASSTGGVAVFSGPGGQALAAKFVFTRVIHAIEWHPQQTSSSDHESEYKNLLAISSAERTFCIVVLQLEDKEDGGKQFTNFTTLKGHTNSVLQVYWNPHRDAQLLSTSSDCTVRIWDVISGECVSIFNGHFGFTLGAAWCPQPQLADKVMSGGNDYCLRLWDINDHPAENYKEVKQVLKKRKRNTNKQKLSVAKVTGEGDDLVSANDKRKTQGSDKDDESGEEMPIDAAYVIKPKSSKKFIMPILARQLNRTTAEGMCRVIQKYIERHKEITSSNIADLAKGDAPEEYDIDFIKLFGNINDVNEVLDKECASHIYLKAYQEYAMLMVFRGRIDSLIQFANEHDLLDPFLLSVAPSVSFKYWKDVTQLYIAQLDRLAIKKPVPPALREPKDENETQDPNGLSKEKVPKSEYGGLIYRKAAALLSVHDVKAAVEVLEKAFLFKEAYILCRCRHMDSIAEETLKKWTYYMTHHGELVIAGLLNIVMGKITEAANVLRRSTQPEVLNLSAELAKVAGLNAFADYIETKAKTAEKESESAAADRVEEDLSDLPTRMELLMKENKVQNGEANSEIDEQSKLLKTELCSKDAVQNGQVNVNGNSTTEVAETTV